MTYSRWLTLLAGAVCLLVVTQTDAHAQTSRGGQTRPRVSPYLNMFRSDLGIMRSELGYFDPYMGFSRPSAPTSRDRTNIQSIGQPSTELLRARARSQQQAAGGIGGIAPTGTGSVFMNYSHYYQAPGRRR